MERKKEKRGEAPNPNKVRTMYLWNIIFLCLLTIVSLVFALFVFFRLRTKGTDGIRKLYSDQQIRKIREAASDRERQILLAQMRSSLESGEGTKLMIREMFSDQIVVESEGKYYFYPIDEDVEKNRIPAGLLLCEDGKTVEYRGTFPSMTLIHGALISEDNGRIDWERLAQSGIDELTIRTGGLNAKAFHEDMQFERNCAQARSLKLPYMMCVEVEEPADDKVVSETAEKIAAMVSEYGFAGESGNSGSDTDSGTAEKPGEQDPGTAEKPGEQDPGTAEKPGGQSDEDKTDAASGPSDAESGGADAERARAAEDDAKANVVVRIRNEARISDNERDRGLWTETIRSLCEKLEKQGVHVILAGSNQTFAAQIDLSELSSYDRWFVDYELSVVFPYSIFCWEFSLNGRLNGVPGEAFLYAKILVNEEW